jgi:hypothetical protein
MISGRSAQGGPHQRHGFKPLWPSSATAAPTRPMIYANPWELHQTGENLQVVCRGRLRNGCAKPVFDRALSRVKRPQNPYKIEHPHYRPVVVARAGAYPLGCCPSYLGVSTYLCSMPCHVPLHTPLPLHPYPVPYPRLVPRRGAGACARARYPWGRGLPCRGDLQDGSSPGAHHRCDTTPGAALATIFVNPRKVWRRMGFRQRRQGVRPERRPRARLARRARQGDRVREVTTRPDHLPISDVG